MPQEKPNPFSEWLLLLREQAPIWRERFENWLDECKEEPRLFWETPAFRYTTYSIGGIGLLWIVFSAANIIAPPLPVSARPRATTADFHVVCENADCAKHYVVHRELGFNAFPVQCPRCKEETGKKAKQCFSPSCDGCWVPPEQIGGMQKCPNCGDAL